MDVLIVEDELLVSRSLVELLEHHGHTARVADDAVEALEMMQHARYRPTVIVLDLILPNMSGRTFLELKSADPAIADIPVVVFTGSATRDLPKGASRLLTKPTNEEALLAALQKAVDERAHRAA